MKKYNTIVFDLDGTLLDTLGDLTDSVNYALGIHGFESRTIKEIRHFVGNGIANLIKRSMYEGRGENGQDMPIDEEKAAAVLADFRAHYGEHCMDKTKPYEGIVELLKKLKEKGIKTAITSNKVHAATAKLSDTFFEGYIDCALGEKEGVKRKPAPDIVMNALKELGSSVEEAVYIGDSEVDITTANNTGMDMIIVTWGFRDRDVLEECGASVIAESVEELESMLIV